MTDVGIGTSFDCMSNPSFKYSFIQVGYGMFEYEYIYLNAFKPL